MSHKDEAENLISKIETTIGTLQAEAAKAQVLVDKERNLEVWRQAYNAALNGISADPTCLSDQNKYARRTADEALTDYLTKREELMADTHGLSELRLDGIRQALAVCEAISIQEVFKPGEPPEVFLSGKKTGILDCISGINNLLDEEIKKRQHPKKGCQTCVHEDNEEDEGVCSRCLRGERFTEWRQR